MGQVLFLTATGVFLQRQLRSRPLNQGKESAMRRRSERHTRSAAERRKGAYRSATGSYRAGSATRLAGAQGSPDRNRVSYGQVFVIDWGRPSRRAEPA